LCKQVFEHRLFHADPHPGNIMLMRNNQIAFLDYGMIGYLEPDDVYAMANLLRAVLAEDPHTCTSALLAFTSAREVENRQALEHEIAEYIAFEAQTVMGKVDIGHTLERVTQILRRHKLQLAPRFSMLLKAMATIESAGRALDPNLDLATIVRPYVEAVIEKRYSPQQITREGQESVMQLLHVARQLPGEVQDAVRTFRQGRTKIQLDHEGLDHLAHVTDRASNRIAFSVIAGSLIVGSSLMLSTTYGVRSLGYAGFIGAGALGVALLISILRSKNY
jgi:ubiquinone biosynthesis protein